MQTTIFIEQFSKDLFWDIDIAELDFKKSMPQIIYKVVEYGKLEDWKLLQQVYSLEEIKTTALELRSLDAVSLNFLSHF